MWTYLIGPFLAFLPRRFRERQWPNSPVDWKPATVVSGFLESVLSLVLLIWWYISYFTFLSQKFIAAREPNPNFLYGWEPVREAGMFSFALHPLTWVIVYLGIEGIVRTLAALTEQRSYGLSALTALDYLYRVVARPAPPIELALVPDEIVPGRGECDIQIASCRQRPAWKYPFTIRYGGTFFQIVGENRLAAGPRPFTYMLRRLPPGEIARGLQECDPQQVLYTAR